MESIKYVIRALLAKETALKKPEEMEERGNVVTYEGHSLKPVAPKSNLWRKPVEQSCHPVSYQLEKKSIKSLHQQRLPEQEQSSQAETEPQQDATLYCENKLCSARGTTQDITEKSKTCPYPLSTFPHLQPTGFLEKNSAAIKEWIKDQLANSAIEIQYIHFHDKGKPDKARLTLTLQYSCKEPSVHLCIRAIDINKGNSARDCFARLLLELRTHLMMIYLRTRNSSIFQNKSGVARYISDYNYWSNEIVLNEKHKIALSKVFNPKDKTFSWDKLKEEMEKQGLSYKSLFNRPLILTRGQTTSFFRKDFFPETKVFMLQATDADIPSGTMHIPSRFMF